VSLLERFMANPTQTRHEIRVKLGVKLGVLDEQAAEVFALILFLCDDLLQFKPALTDTTITTASAATLRFFAIVKWLPMELQMVLCHRAVGSMKQNILHNNSEEAFKLLAMILALSQSPARKPPSPNSTKGRKRERTMRHKLNTHKNNQRLFFESEKIKNFSFFHSQFFQFQFESQLIIVLREAVKPASRISLSTVSELATVVSQLTKACP